MKGSLANVYRLGVKELIALWRDPVMIVLIAYSFTLMVYTAARALPETLHKAPIAIVDEDGSPLATRIASAFYPPYFLNPKMISLQEVDPGMDAGRFTFAIDIPPDFQRDVLAGRSPALQLNVDATRMSQAFTGYVDIQQILPAEVNEFVQRYRANLLPPVDLAMRVRFNPNLERPWFGAVVQLIDAVTMLSIILAGAALIREREHGTVEHLLVMPVTPAEIMLAKVWSAALVVLVATAFSLGVVVQWILQIPVQGPVWLFLTCAALHLFATTSMGIFMATIARSMPQFGLLVVLVLIPMQLLSGGVTPRESMPDLVQKVMLGAPTTHFVAASQGILYRGGGIEVVWPQMLAITAIAAVFFTIALMRFRKTITLMA
jgi:ABC-2 type transport system permease protein